MERIIQRIFMGRHHRLGCDAPPPPGCRLATRQHRVPPVPRSWVGTDQDSRDYHPRDAGLVAFERGFVAVSGDLGCGQRDALCDGVLDMAATA